MKNNKMYNLSFIGYRNNSEKVNAQLICSIKYAKKLAKNLVNSCNYDIIDVMDNATGEIYFSSEKINGIKKGKMFLKDITICDNFPKK